MKKKLEGQTAIVTGASSGIGAGVAKALALEGAFVVINFHSGEEKAKAVLAEIQQAGGDGVTIQADVSKEPEVVSMFQHTIKQCGTWTLLSITQDCKKILFFMR